MEKWVRPLSALHLNRGHEIVLKIDLDNGAELTKENLSKADVAIEFTGPPVLRKSVEMRRCRDPACLRIYRMAGTVSTAIKQAFEKNGSAFLYASNFSIGVNIFFELNKKLAPLMAPHPEYSVEMREIHHTQKKDAPSGTAITLAEQVMAEIPLLKTG